MILDSYPQRQWSGSLAKVERLRQSREWAVRFHLSVQHDVLTECLISTGFGILGGFIFEIPERQVDDSP